MDAVRILRGDDWRGAAENPISFSRKDPYVVSNINYYLVRNSSIAYSYFRRK